MNGHLIHPFPPPPSLQFGFATRKKELVSKSKPLYLFVYRSIYCTIFFLFFVVFFLLYSLPPSSLFHPI